MGYLICEKCGGYYELQPGENPEDFSDECECGGKLIYSETLDFDTEDEVYSNVDNINDYPDQVESDSFSHDESDLSSHVESDLSSQAGHDLPSQAGSDLDSDVESDLSNEYIDPDITVETEEESNIYNEEEWIEENTDNINQYTREEIKYATQLQDILDIKGYYQIMGSGSRKAFKILPEGIVTDQDEFIKFEEIINVESFGDRLIDPDRYKRLDKESIMNAAQELIFPGKSTIKITCTYGEIELKDLKRSDARKLFSFIDRMIIKQNNK